MEWLLSLLYQRQKQKCFCLIAFIGLVLGCSSDIPLVMSPVLGYMGGLSIEDHQRYCDNTPELRSDLSDTDVSISIDGRVFSWAVNLSGEYVGISAGGISIRSVSGANLSRLENEIYEVSRSKLIASDPLSFRYSYWKNNGRERDFGLAETSGPGFYENGTIYLYEKITDVTNAKATLDVVNHNEVNDEQRYFPCDKDELEEILRGLDEKK